MANDKKRKLRLVSTDGSGRRKFSNSIDDTVFHGGVLGKNRPVGNHEIPDKVFQRELKEYREGLVRVAQQSK